MAGNSGKTLRWRLSGGCAADLVTANSPTRGLQRWHAWRIVLAAALLLVLVCGSSAAVSADRRSELDRRRTQFQQRRSELLQELRTELRELSNQCYDQGLQQAAVDLTSLSLELTNPSVDYHLPKMARLETASAPSDPNRLWRNRLNTLRQVKAKALYVLARQALRADLPSTAYALVQDVLRMDSDHAHARAVLGQELFQDVTRKDDPTYAGEWVSPFEARKRKGIAPEVNHPEFGWLPAAHVQRYENGERLWRGRWTSAEKEVEIRRDFTKAWEIRSEHFLVKTNTSLEEGVQISQKLEIFHAWLRSNFAAFFDTPAALMERFEQAQLRRRNTSTDRPMEVHYYARRSEYDRRMRGKIPPNIVTNGYYCEDDRTSYFFRNPDADGLATVYHEATHQILDLTTAQHRRNAARKKQRVLRHRRFAPWRMCEKSNFWIVEGLACYFESFAVNEGVASVGRPDYTRFVAAQHRMLRDRFYVPLQPFCGLGQQQFQEHPNIAQLYSQASGVVHFLLHYGDGVYRDNFVEMLAAIYRPDLNNVLEEPSLTQITGVEFARLDQQYREHLENMVLQQRDAVRDGALNLN